MLAAAGPGCSDYDFEKHYGNSAAQEYAGNFVERFGAIDPEHTWNTADTRTASVEINYEGQYVVRFYTADPHVHPELTYLLGEFTDVEGPVSRTFEFDAPTALNGVCIAVEDMLHGGTIYRTSLFDKGNAQAVFGVKGTRTVVEDGNYITDGGILNFPKEAFDKFLELIPEDDITNSSKPGISKNFSYLSNGPFTICPIYSHTSQFPSLSVHYKLPGNDTFTALKVWDFTQPQARMKDSKGNYSWYTNRSGWALSGTEDATGLEFVYMRGEAIHMNFPVGTEFYFSIYANNQNFYSREELNTTTNKPHMVTFNNGYRYTTTTADGSLVASPVIFVGIEDSPRVLEDDDWNDLVFAIIGDYVEGSTTVTIPDIVDMDTPVSTGIEYLIAYEDLGDTDDFDFNDVVISVGHVSGQNYATVKLKAAGGTMGTQVLYDDAAGVSTILWNEVHAAFGVDTATMVNTGIGDRLPELSTTITVGEEFKIRDAAPYFKIKLIDQAEETVINVPGTEGVAPQAILVADPAWEWPSERQSIESKYPEFATWAKDFAAGDSWYSRSWPMAIGTEETTGGGYTPDEDDTVLTLGEDIAPSAFKDATKAILRFIVASDGAQFSLKLQDPAGSVILSNEKDSDPAGYMKDQVIRFELAGNSLEIVKESGLMFVDYPTEAGLLASEFYLEIEKGGSSSGNTGGTPSGGGTTTTETLDQEAPEGFEDATVLDLSGLTKSESELTSDFIIPLAESGHYEFGAKCAIAFSNQVYAYQLFHEATVSIPSNHKITFDVPSRLYASIFTEDDDDHMGSPNTGHLTLHVASYDQDLQINKMWIIPNEYPQLPEGATEVPFGREGSWYTIERDLFSDYESATIHLIFSRYDEAAGANISAWYYTTSGGQEMLMGEATNSGEMIYNFKAYDCTISDVSSMANDVVRINVNSGGAVLYQVGISGTLKSESGTSGGDEGEEGNGGTSGGEEGGSGGDDDTKTTIALGEEVDVTEYLTSMQKESDWSYGTSLALTSLSLPDAYSSLTLKMEMSESISNYEINAGAVWGDQVCKLYPYSASIEYSITNTTHIATLFSSAGWYIHFYNATADVKINKITVTINN